MPSPTLLGQLAALHELLSALPTRVPEADCYERFDPALESLAWLLGRAVYLETFWLREVVAGDDRLTARVRALFEPGLGDEAPPLPPRDHLLNWALEIQEENLLRLANPGALPPHPLLDDDRLLAFLVQQEALLYEDMLRVLQARQGRLKHDDFHPREPLRAATPPIDAAGIEFGHYRLGGDPERPHFDNELPPQVVELHAARIARKPVNNAWYLTFIEAGGYADEACWTDAGRAWRQREQRVAPAWWRRDSDGEWYEIGLNGPLDLPPDEPVGGLSRHEAEAFANWLGHHHTEYQGAVLAHEYQWELATRTQRIEDTGRVLEWCGNDFFAYDGFTPFPDIDERREQFARGDASLRGSHRHSQKILRRPSLRRHAPADDGRQLAGCRLVFPPE